MVWCFEQSTITRAKAMMTLWFVTVLLLLSGYLLAQTSDCAQPGIYQPVQL